MANTQTLIASGLLCLHHRDIHSAWRSLSENVSWPRHRKAGVSSEERFGPTGPVKWKEF